MTQCGLKVNGCKLSKPGSERQRPHVFSYMWKIDPKDKHILKNKHDHIQTYIQNMFVIAELLYGGKGKESDKSQQKESDESQQY
jgi:hypothetical protein